MVLRIECSGSSGKELRNLDFEDIVNIIHPFQHNSFTSRRLGGIDERETLFGRDQFFFDTRDAAHTTMGTALRPLPSQHINSLVFKSSPNQGDTAGVRYTPAVLTIPGVHPRMDLGMYIFVSRMKGPQLNTSHLGQPRCLGTL